MSKKLQAFVGVESYDLIHFISRVLLALGQRVLLVDGSSDKSLYFSIPEANNSSVIDYRGVHFVNEPLLTKGILNDYDWIIGYYGWNFKSTKLPAFSEIYVVTDLQLHNIERCKRLPIFSKSSYTVIARDVVGGRFNGRIVQDELSTIGYTRFYALPYDAIDYRYKLASCYDTRAVFRKVSRDIRNTMCGIIGDDWDEKTILKCIKYACRGY